MTDLKAAQQLVGYFSRGGVQGLLQVKHLLNSVRYCHRRLSRDTKTQECSKDKGLGTNPSVETGKIFIRNVWHISKIISSTMSKFDMHKFVSDIVRKKFVRTII
jgi:hypothetical protein